MSTELKNDTIVKIRTITIIKVNFFKSTGISHQTNSSKNWPQKLSSVYIILNFMFL